MAAAAAGHHGRGLSLVAAALLLAGAAVLADAGGGHRQGRQPNVPAKTVCVKVHGVVAGETCASVARDAGLTDQGFATLNPNVTCATLFPGQWLCIDGALIG